MIILLISLVFLFMFLMFDIIFRFTEYNIKDLNIEESFSTLSFFADSRLIYFISIFFSFVMYFLFNKLEYSILIFSFTTFVIYQIRSFIFYHYISDLHSLYNKVS